MRKHEIEEKLYHSDWNFAPTQPSIHSLLRLQWPDIYTPKRRRTRTIGVTVRGLVIMARRGYDTSH